MGLCIRFKINTEHLAENLADALFDRIEKPNGPTRTILINGKITERDSAEKLF